MCFRSSGIKATSTPLPSIAYYASVGVPPTGIFPWPTTVRLVDCQSSYGRIRDGSDKRGKTENAFDEIAQTTPPGGKDTCVQPQSTSRKKLRTHSFVKWTTDTISVGNVQVAGALHRKDASNAAVWGSYT